MLVGGGQHHLSAFFRCSLCRIFNQIEKDLDQLVTVAENIGQRGVVTLDEAEVTGEAVLGDLAHMLQHRMDVDGLTLQGPLVGKHLHAVDQGHDAVGLVADEAGQHPVGLGGVFLQQLRGSADARERILDLVGQHCRHCRHRAGGVAVGELVVDLAGQRALMQQDHRGVGLGARSGDLGRDDLAAGARRVDEDAVLGHAVLAAQHLIDHREQRAVEGQSLVEATAYQMSSAGIEEGFGLLVDVADHPPGVHRQHRLGQGIENGGGVQAKAGAGRPGGSDRPARRRGRRSGGARHQAAFLSINGENSEARRARTRSGSVKRLISERKSAEPGRPLLYQPRCLRAMRRPCSAP